MGVVRLAGIASGVGSSTKFSVRTLLVQRYCTESADVNIRSDETRGSLPILLAFVEASLSNEFLATRFLAVKGQ